LSRQRPMAQKSNNNILILVLLILTFPLWIGLAGGLIGIFAGVFGLAIGLLAGVFGIVVSIFAAFFSVFTWPFQEYDGFFHFDGESLIWLLLIFFLGLALLNRSIKSKKETDKKLKI
jgi:hypothetical protein